MMFGKIIKILIYVYEKLLKKKLRLPFCAHQLQMRNMKFRSCKINKFPRNMKYSFSLCMLMMLLTVSPRPSSAPQLALTNCMQI